MTKVVQLKFGDGHVVIARPDDRLRLMMAGTYGIQTWQVQHLLDGIWPPCAPDTVWLYVTERGEEHPCRGLVCTVGTLEPVAPVAPVAPAVAAPDPIAETFTDVPPVAPPVKKTKRKAA